MKQQLHNLENGLQFRNSGFVSLLCNCSFSSKPQVSSRLAIGTGTRRRSATGQLQVQQQASCWYNSNLIPAVLGFEQDGTQDQLAHQNSGLLPGISKSRPVKPRGKWISFAE
ncbi:hypothetical protein Nepgr_024842 [Nepenthes gracilis]|uniref:Uncharacterized protein n=1 Tax=Nepenthes gracilis TaxID=150966 RepID=A0AAD3T5V7_NEPGR|nr:hypothetical protein Nepgr_024842 [Nepenthes gracilis]